MMIFLFFKPLNIKERKFKDVPLFELQSFTMYELDLKGLKTVMHGTTATRFSNRYTVENINYTDNSKEYISNMKARNGVYKNNIVKLNGDVEYSREDGLNYESQKATYYKKTSIAESKSDFIAYMGKNSITGSSIVYDNKNKTVKAKDTIVKYDIQERKQ